MVHGRILEIRHDVHPQRKGGGLRRNQAIRQAPPAKSLSPRCATNTGCQLGSWLLASIITASPAWIYNWTMQYTCSYARLGSYGAFCRRRPEFFRLTPSQSSVDLPSVRIPTTYLIGCNLICLSIQEQCLPDSHDLHHVVRPWGRPSPVLAYPY